MGERPRPLATIQQGTEKTAATTMRMSDSAGDMGTSCQEQISPRPEN